LYLSIGPDLADFQLRSTRMGRPGFTLSAMPLLIDER
jgi:hypothetical protein